MKKPYIALFSFFLISLILVYISYIFIQDKQLRSVTCRDYWELHQEAQSDLSKKESFMMWNVKLWNNVVQSLRLKNSNLNFYEWTEVNLNDEKGNPYFFMMVMMSCPHTHGLMDDVLYVNLERNLLKTLHQKEQKEAARQAGCRVYDGTQAKLFDKNAEGRLSICTSQKYGSGKVSIKKDKFKKPTHLEFCGKGYGYSALQECVEISPTQESFCLSDYGACAKNADSVCEWQHTEKSKKCLNR